jgi:8-oxo-dGDP phosphatase
VRIVPFASLAPALVARRAPVVPAVRDHLEDRGEELRLGGAGDRFGQPQVGGQLEPVRDGDPDVPEGRDRVDRLARRAESLDVDGLTRGRHPRRIGGRSGGATVLPEPCDDAAMTERSEPDPAVRVGPWTRHARRIAYDNAWITIWHDDVARPDGSPGIYGVVHFANLAVGAVVLDADERVLLVGQHRYTLDAYSWEIPEGGVPAGESPLDGARREVREETGVEADGWREIVRFHLSNSISDEAGVIFAARATSHGTASPEPSEELAVRWTPFTEALAMTADGRITDAMTIMGLQRLALERAEARGATGPQ